MHYHRVKLRYTSCLISERGISLIELLVTMLITSIVVALFSGTFISQRRAFSVHEQLSDLSQNIRGALEIVTKEARMAGYDPLKAGIIGIPYDATQLIIQADLNEDGDILDSNEVITYSYDNTLKQLNRTANGQTNVVAERVNAFVVNYLDKDGNNTTASSDIKEMELSISGETEKQDSGYQQNSGHRIFSLSSRIAPRNLQ